MRFGGCLPTASFSTLDRGPTWEGVVESATWFDAHGFSSVWAPDHLFLERTPLGPGTAAMLDPLVTLAGLAASVRRVRLGTLVLAEGLRAPSVVAKTFASLDRLAGGRVDVGLGAGWHEAEYRRAGLRFPPPGERLARLGETAQIVRGMLGGERTTYTGQHHRVVDAPNLPQPVQSRVPIWIAATGDRALRVVARHADGWNVAWRWDPERYAERMAELERACEEVGRDPAEIRRSVGLLTLVGDSPRAVGDVFRRWKVAAGTALAGVQLEDLRRRGMVGTLEDARELVDRYAALGVDELVLSFGPVPFAWYPEAGGGIVAEGLVSRP